MKYSSRKRDYKIELVREFVTFWNNVSLKQFITAFYKDELASKDEIEELRNAIEELGRIVFRVKRVYPFLIKEAYRHI